MFRFLLIVGFSIFGLSLSGFAQTSGTFMVVKGEVTVTSKDGKVDKAKVGKKVLPSDLITSAADSRAKIVMADQNVINISPDTKLLLEKYIYDPATNNKQVVLNVMEGKVRATVEQKYDGEKNQFHVKTPAAVAGVRGTDFLTSYSSATNEAKIVTFQGKVAVGTPGPGGTIQNAVFVTPGQMTTASNGRPPALPSMVPKDEFKSMNNSTKADVPKQDSTNSNSGRSGSDNGSNKGDKSADSDKNSKAPAQQAQSQSQSQGPAGAQQESNSQSQGNSSSTNSSSTSNSSANSSGASASGGNGAPPSPSSTASSAPAPDPSRAPASSAPMPAPTPVAAPVILAPTGGCSLCNAGDLNVNTVVPTVTAAPGPVLPPQINIPNPTLLAPVPSSVTNAISTIIQNQNNGPVKVNLIITRP